MKIYILGKLGKLSFNEWVVRNDLAGQVEIDGHTPINFDKTPNIEAINQGLLLLTEIVLLIKADMVIVLNDFNNCENARALLVIATRLNLQIKAANGCTLPSKICIEIN
jgi:hypothetical protein